MATKSPKIKPAFTAGHVLKAYLLGRRHGANNFRLTLGDLLETEPSGDEDKTDLHNGLCTLERAVGVPLKTSRKILRMMIDD